MNEQLAAIITTSILSPMVCFAGYLCYKMYRDIAKTMRRNDVIDAIKKDHSTREAIVTLITDKMKDDYQFQQAIVTLVTEQLQKNIRLEQAVTSIARKAN
jgi:hypothetical protein